jgi:hypothetical protein
MTEHLEANKETEAILMFQEEITLQHHSSEVVEVSLLLSSRQISALEAAAHRRGLTAGEMVRRLLQDFIAGRAPAKSACTVA